MLSRPPSTMRVRCRPRLRWGTLLLAWSLLPLLTAVALAQGDGVDVDSIFGDLERDQRQFGSGEDPFAQPGVPPIPGSAPALDTAPAPEKLREEEQVAFKADFQQSVDEDRTLRLDGNVVIYFRDMVFFCDHARLDDRQKLFYGVGNTRLEMPDRIINGSSFWYDYGKDTFMIREARGHFNAGMGEPMYFVSREVRGHVKDFKLVSTTLTTCAPGERREWHIKASMVKVLSDKKVRMRNATFFFYGIPLFFFPFYDYSLELTSVIVEVGKNRSEGTFVKLRFNYLYEPQDHLFGAITTSYRSRLGYTLGTDHRYAFNSKEWPGKLTTNTEFLTDGDKNRNAYTFSVSQRFDLLNGEIVGDVSANQNSRTNLQGGGRTESSGANINLNRQKPGADSMSLRYSYTQQKSTTTTSTANVSFTHQHQFGLATSSNSSLNYTSQSSTQGLANDQRLDLSSDLASRAKTDGKELLDWRLSYKQSIDPDGNRVQKQYEKDVLQGGGDPIPDPADPGNDSYETEPPPSKLVDPDSLSQTLSELPKLTVNIRPGVLGNKPNKIGIETTRTSITLAHYVQRRAQDRINAVFAEADLGFRRNWKPDATTNIIDATINYKQNFTGTGDALYSFSPSLRWERKESNNLRQSFNWTYNDTEGASPITSGAGGGNSSNLAYTLNYQTRFLQWNASTGRNFVNNTWSAINLQGTWTPNPGVNDFRLTFSTGYDLETDQWRDLTLQSDWQNFKSFRTNFNLVYNIENDELREIRNRTEYKFSPRLFTEFNLRYSPKQTDPAILQDIIITWLRDCTFWQLSYRSAGDIFLLNAGITAYPSRAFAYGVNASNLIQNPFQQFGEGFGAGPGGFQGGGFGIGGGGFGF